MPVTTAIMHCLTTAGAKPFSLLLQMEPSMTRSGNEDYMGLSDEPCVTFP